MGGLEIDLTGRRALVTGGGNGVGTEICDALVRAGAFVWVNDIYEERAEKVAAELGGPEHARPMKADVTSPLKIGRMREQTGPVDILINNAGIPTSGFALKLFVDTNPEDWEETMRLNLGAVLHVTHAYLGAMVDERWGRIVTIASDAGRKGERYQAIYGAAKVPLTFISENKFTFTVPAGAVPGPAYVQALNPPFVPENGFVASRSCCPNNPGSMP
jgi:3-oxoacyl-[acyl-carrier protein] reductase